MKNFSYYLKQVRKKKLKITQEKAAELIGIERTNLSAYERDKHNPNYSTMMTIIEKLGLKPYDFFSDEPLIPKSYAKKEPVIFEVFQDQEIKTEYGKFRTRDDFIPIRILADAASLGHGRIISEEETKGYALIYKYALKKKAWTQKRDDEKIICLFVEGNSMEPTIQNGNVIAIDVEDKYEIQNNKIYAVELPDEGVTIKRVYIDDQHLMLFADNKDYRGYPKCINKNQIGYHPIGGKVVWTWSKLD